MNKLLHLLVESENSSCNLKADHNPTSKNSNNKSIHKGIRRQAKDDKKTLRNIYKRGPHSESSDQQSSQMHEQSCASTDKCNASQTSELSNLLRTNKILIQNKRTIQETKIRSYASKIGQMSKLMQETKSAGDKENLWAAARELQKKKRETEIKLQKLNQIELQIMEAQKEDQILPKCDQPVQSDNQWRVKSHTNNQMQPFNSTMNHPEKTNRFQRRLSCQFSQKKLKAHQCRLFKQKFSDKELTESEDEEQPDGMRHSDTIYKDLGSCSDKNGKGRRQSGHNICVEQNGKAVEGQTKIKVNEFVVAGQKLSSSQPADHLSKCNQQCKKINSRIANIHSKISEDSSISQPLHALQMLDTIDSRIDSLLHSRKCLPDKDPLALEIQRTILENKKRQKQSLDSQVSQLLQRQREMNEQIEQLSEWESQLSEQVIAELSRCQKQFKLIIEQVQDVDLRQQPKFELPHQKDCIWNSRNEKIPELRSAVEGYQHAFSQATELCKLKILEQTEYKLTLQYKVSILSAKLSQSKSMHQEITSQICKQKQILRGLEEENKCKKKQIEKFNDIVSGLEQDIQEVEEQLAAKNLANRQLQSTYNATKEKKGRAEKSLRGLEQSIQAAHNKIQLQIGQISDKQMCLKQKLNQLHEAEHEKQILINDIQKDEAKLAESQQKLEQIKTKMQEKTEKLRVVEKQLRKLQEKRGKISEGIEELAEKESEIVQEISVKRKLLSLELEPTVHAKKKQLSMLEQKIANKKNSLSQLKASHSAFINKSSQEKQRLSQEVGKLTEILDALKVEHKQASSAKDELQQMLTEVLLRKDEIVVQLEQKYIDVEGMEKCKEDYESQLQSLNEILLGKQACVKREEERAQELQGELTAMAEKREQEGKRLKAILQELCFHQGEEQNLLQRVKALKSFEMRATLAVGLNSEIQETNINFSDRIREIIDKVMQVDNSAAEVLRYRQQNRKLKSENERLKQAMESYRILDSNDHRSRQSLFGR